MLMTNAIICRFQDAVSEINICPHNMAYETVDQNFFFPAHVNFGQYPKIH